MAIITFLIAIVGLSALIYAGMRFNMYLYLRNALGPDTHVQSVVGGETFPIQPARDVSELQERNYGLRYARITFLFIIGVIVTIMISLIVSLFSVAH